MSRVEKIIRIVVGVLFLIYFGLLAPTWWAFLGLIPLMTGVSGFCPIYFIVNRLKTPKEESKPSKRKKKKQKDKLDIKNIFKQDDYEDEPLFKD